MGRILSCHGKKTTGKDNNKTHPNHIDTIFSGKNRYGCCRNLEDIRQIPKNSEDKCIKA